MTTHAQTIKHSRIVQRSPIFYGWVVWLVATIGLIATAPGQSFSVSLFIDYYITDFGLGRTTVAGLYGLGTFIAALWLTWVGRQIDRYGNRRVSIVTAALFAAVLIACSLIMGPITILISFIAVRGLGQGALGLVSTTAVAQWFQRRRGQIMGFSLIAFALFQRFYLPWMQAFIDTHGWRTAWVLSGLVLGFAIMPLLGLFLRDRPENFGLVPDGNQPATPPARSHLVTEDNWELAQALRTPILWVFIFGRMLAAAWGTALIFHQVSLFEGLGHAPSVAAQTFGEIALVTAGFTLISGWIVDHWRPHFLMVIQISALIASIILSMIMTSSALLTIYTVSFGIFMGIGAVFDNSVWVNIYGRQHQGAIRGFVATMFVIGTAIGPVIYGLAFDLLGSYEVASLLGLALAFIAIPLVLYVKIPRMPGH